MREDRRRRGREPRVAERPDELGAIRCGLTTIEVVRDRLHDGERELAIDARGERAQRVGGGVPAVGAPSACSLPRDERDRLDAGAREERQPLDLDHIRGFVEIRRVERAD